MAGRELNLIEIAGEKTCEEIGKAIGKALKDEIRRNLEIYLDELQYNKKSDSITELTNSYLIRCRRFFPDYLKELNGIADGSGAAFKKLFLFSLEEELLATPYAHCTSIAAKSKDDILFGHNEDWDSRYALYLIKAKPKGKPGFISLSYAGQFPGTSVGYNDCGIAYGGNSLKGKVNHNGLPKTYLLRTMLEARNVNEIVEDISKRKRAIGNSSLIVSAEEEKIYCFRWNIHDCSFSYGEDYRASTDEGMHNGNIAERANKLLAEFVKSKKRSIADFKKILQDHEHYKGSPWSICEHAFEKTGKDHQTVASVVIETKKGVMHVAYGNPCRTEYKRYSL